MNSDNYKRLGDYIRQVDVRNKDLAVTRLVGVSINKSFIPSVANVIDTDLSNYKLINQKQFACNLMHVDRDEIVPIAMFNEDEAIISPAYPVFEVGDTETLLPEYLMMCFTHKEFDRRASYYSGVGIRGGLAWDDFCNMLIPVPKIDSQREIVDRYETTSRRISLNEKIIAKLEEAAQTLYRKYFVYGIDLNHLLEGWRMGTLSDIAQISSGTTCVDKTDVKSEDYLYPVVGATGIIGYSTLYNQQDRLLTVGRVGTLGVVNRYNEQLFAADNVLVIKSANYEYCYQLLKDIDYEEITRGGVQNLITQTELKNTKALLPPKEVLCSYEGESARIFSLVSMKLNENKMLNELKTLILTTMTKI